MAGSWNLSHRQGLDDNPTCLTQVFSEILKYYEDLKLPTEFLSENNKSQEQKRSLQHKEEDS
jgi:hypothetical protein